jgi:purine-nucleoside phosphorylase
MIIDGMDPFDRVQESVRVIHARAGGVEPKVGLILGSGLGSFADTFESAVVIPYHEIPFFQPTSVVGHPGRLVIGRVQGEWAIALQGRAHYYEGHSPQQLAHPTRVLCSLGIRALLVTNAAGAVNPNFLPGELMAISDHLNLAGWNPLTGPNDDRFGARFPDMSEAYDRRLLQLLLQTASKQSLGVRTGVYAMLAGPSYETPAEVRALRVLGADAVGMSTVSEVLIARQMGVKVAGLSCITNLAPGLRAKPLSHEEVAETAERVQGAFSAILREFIPQAGKLLG